MWKSITVNWTTSIPAFFLLLCGSAEMANIIPDELFRYWMGLCAFLTAVGFFAAKSANVSHDPVTKEPKIVETK